MVRLSPFRTVAASTVLAAFVGLGVWAALALSIDRPVTYLDDLDHFKYGSIGSEPGASVLQPVGGNLPPYWIFRALPTICPEKFPRGFAGFGLLSEPGRELPIGISRRRRIGLDLVGMNCALCHTGTVRHAPTAPPQIVPGMPAHALDVFGLTRAVVECVLDARLTPAAVLATLPPSDGPSAFERLLIRTGAISRLKRLTHDASILTSDIFGGRVPPWGIGRVDTFNPYKSLLLGWNLSTLSASELTAPTDLPSLWNQGPREGMRLHWDGNNDSVDERNLSASLGAGVRPATADVPAIRRVMAWTWTLRPPPYPYAVDPDLAARGQGVYAAHCASCHADHRFRDGIRSVSRVGTVEPIDSLGTDRHRLDSFTQVFMTAFTALYPDAPFHFTHFAKTNGYANLPLDGVWLRGPFLHNGSVPTVRDLLEPAASRPRRFYRGYDVVDQEELGFVSSVATDGGRTFFPYDVTVVGNGNAGHEYGTMLPDDDKRAIVEYLKRF